MIIAHEETAPGMEINGECKRILKVLLSPKLQSDLDAVAAGFTIIPPQSMSDPHAHVEGEMFFVCSGHGHVFIEDECEKIKPGTAVWGPPWKRHYLANTGMETLKVLWVLCPPGREEAILENKSK